MESAVSSPGSDAFERAVGEPIVVAYVVVKMLFGGDNIEHERMSCTHNRELDCRSNVEPRLACASPSVPPTHCIPYQRTQKNLFLRPVIQLVWKHES